MTNLEYIKSMSLEEMTEFIHKIGYDCGKACQGCYPLPYMDCRNCTKNISGWLQEERIKEKECEQE